MENAILGLSVFNSVFSFIITALAIAVYILRALGLYEISKRRGIKNPWLSFIPVTDAYILGAIADDYNLKVKNKKTSFRNILLYLLIGMYVLVIGMYPVIILSAIKLGITTAFDFTSLSTGLGFIIGLMTLLFVILALSLTVTVLSYICYYKLFASCSKLNYLTYFLISFFISQTLAFFIFAVRKKDEGMEIIQGE